MDQATFPITGHPQVATTEQFDQYPHPKILIDLGQYRQGRNSSHLRPIGQFAHLPHLSLRVSPGVRVLPKSIDWPETYWLANIVLQRKCRLDGWPGSSPDESDSTLRNIRLP